MQEKLSAARQGTLEPSRRQRQGSGPAQPPQDQQQQQALQWQQQQLQLQAQLQQQQQEQQQQQQDQELLQNQEDPSLLQQAQQQEAQLGQDQGQQTGQKEKPGWRSLTSERLRTQLRFRGLTIGGLKPALVQRITDAAGPDVVELTAPVMEAPSKPLEAPGPNPLLEADQSTELAAGPSDVTDLSSYR